MLSSQGVNWRGVFQGPVFYLLCNPLFELLLKTVKCDFSTDLKTYLLSFSLRFELDFLEQADKFSDNFYISIDLEVSQDKAQSMRSAPWDTFETQRITPKYCFSNQAEWDRVLTQYGK